MYIRGVKQTVYLLSVSGRVEFIDELVDVRVLTDGGLRGNASPEKVGTTSQLSIC